LKSVYPYAAHFNDPFTPTIDINFGLPREIYYDNTYGSITITNANLYETYHRKELEQLTDLKAIFYLTQQTSLTYLLDLLTFLIMNIGHYTK
jgi:hypothetical protein